MIQVSNTDFHKAVRLLACFAKSPLPTHKTSRDGEARRQALLLSKKWGKQKNAPVRRTKLSDDKLYIPNGINRSTGISPAKESMSAIDLDLEVVLEGEGLRIPKEDF